MARVLLVRAVEESDPAGEALPFRLRDEATRAALGMMDGGNPGIGAGAPTPATWRFLTARAGLLWEPAATVAGLGWTRLAPAGAWRRLLWVVAFVFGMAAHAAGLTRSFDLLAGPFVAVLAWNFCVYVAMLFRLPSRGGGGWMDVVAGWLLEKRMRAVTGAAPPVAARVAGSLLPWAKPWLGWKLASWFHVGSICFTLGLMASVYTRGLFTQYLAGWESTWLAAGAMDAVVGSLLRPASWLTGLPLPESPAGWEALRRAAGDGGVPAGPWIHLYAVTMALFVLLPRLALAGHASRMSAVARKQPPPWPAGDLYVRRTLAMAGDQGAMGVAVIPYGFRKSGELDAGAYRDALERLVRMTWGARAHAAWVPPVPYGADDVMERLLAAAPGCLAVVLLFDAAATPEREVHGAALAVVRAMPWPEGMLVLLETGEFPGDRLPDRLKAWQNMTDDARLRILPVRRAACLPGTAMPTDFLAKP